MFSLVGSHKFWWFTNLILFLTCLFIKRRNFFFTGWRLGESKRCGSKDCTEWDILSSYIQILARRRIIHAIIKSRKPPWDLEMYNNYFLLFFNLSATCSDSLLLTPVWLHHTVICKNSAELIQLFPLLQFQISAIPLGTWLPTTGRGSGRPLSILRRDALLSSALNLLLEGKLTTKMQKNFLGILFFRILPFSVIKTYSPLSPDTSTQNHFGYVYWKSRQIKTV